jgi:NADH dehydrogenase/NADH:ubiquinone oxidoreductase subunit G
MNLLGLNFLNTLNITQKKFIFFIGLDSYDNFLKKISKDSFIVTQTPFSDTALTNSNLILPSTSFIEKEVIFVNLEGRAQRTLSALPVLGLARHDEQILKTIYTQNFKKESFIEVLVSSNTFNNFIENKIMFTKNLFLFQKLIPKKVYKTSYKISLSNFYITNAITKNSLIMAKSFLLQKQKYRNFI